MFISLAPWFRWNLGWQFLMAGDRGGGARVIEFRVPQTFQAHRRRWFGARKPGKLIQFPLREVRKPAREFSAMIEPKA